ncbi:MAG: OmpA family protein [Methylococcales bacterium]|nr:OmpA family protein [Methylococcales bacterium]MDP3839357.1 OmpA family protein [Methylococcales bacterium]
MQKKLFTAAAIAALMSGCAAQPMPTFEPFQAQDLNPLLAAGYTQKVDNFFIINDSSSSMSDDYLGLGYASQPDATKFSVEKTILSRINETIPNLPNPVTESIRSFGFGPCLDNGFTKLNQEPTAYSKAALSAGIDSLECSSGGSPLDDGIVGSTADLAPTAGKIAVLVMSDGHDLDSYGTKEMKAMKEQYGDRLCVYGVWTGNPEEISGLAVLNQLSSIAGCGFAVSAESVSTPEKLGLFVKTIFLEPGPIAPVILPHLHVDVEFDNDEYTLEHSTLVKSHVNGHHSNPETVKQNLENQVKSILTTPDSQYEVQGHTNYTGKEARNILLGNERAQTIYNYLTSNYPDLQKQLMQPKGYSWNCPDEADPRSPHNRRVDLELNGGCQHTAISTQELKQHYGNPVLGGKHKHKHKHHHHHHH